MRWITNKWYQDKIMFALWVKFSKLSVTVAVSSLVWSFESHWQRYLFLWRQGTNVYFAPRRRHNVSWTPHSAPYLTQADKNPESLQHNDGLRLGQLGPGALQWRIICVNWQENVDQYRYQVISAYNSDQYYKSHVFLSTITNMTDASCCLLTIYGRQNNHQSANSMSSLLSLSRLFEMRTLRDGKWENEINLWAESWQSTSA